MGGFDTFDYGNCCNELEYRLFGQGTFERRPLYIFVFILQVPFLVTDLAISLSAEQSDCMDRAYVSTAYVLRPWLLAMGIC